VQATRVTYAEAFYSVPEYMTEVEADGVRGYDVNPGGRSFVGQHGWTARPNAGGNDRARALGPRFSA
jgi:hypothetical protein